MQTDAEIVRLVLQGDREAFATLVARHEKAVWITAWRIVHDEHAALDVAQDAFLHAFQRLPGLRQPELFGAWLLRITRREAIRAARTAARLSPCPVDEKREGSYEVVQRDGDAADLVSALARLPEHERLVVCLRYLEGHSVSDIGRVLGRPVGTVTKQLSRGITRLKSLLVEVTR